MSRKFLSTIEAVAKYPDKSIYVPPGSGSTTFDNNIEFGHFGGSPSSEGEIWIYKNVYVEGTAYISMSTGSRLTLGADPTIPLHAATKQYVDSKLTTASQYPYQWSNQTTMAAPGNGYVRANNAAPASTTQLAVSLYDRNGAVHVAILQQAVGDELVIYQSEDLSKSIKYTISATPTNNANQWASVPVTFVTQAAGGFSPSNNGNIEFALRTAAGGGGSGGAPDWTLGYSTYDARYVNVNGDMMTGNLGLPAGSWHNLGVTTALMIGPANGTHAAYSYAGIQAHAAGGVTPQQFWLNQYGGTVQVGPDGLVCGGGMIQAGLSNPVTLTSTNNGLTVGNPYSGISMAFSATEIGVRSAGSATRLKLQPAGGDVELGSDLVNSGLLLRGPGPANNGIWMYTGNPGAFTGQIYCDWASLPTMIYESPRIGGVISMRASAAGDTTGKFEVLTGGAQRLSITDTFVTASAPGVFESGLSLSGGNLNLNAYANLIQLMNASVRQGYLRSDSGWAARMTAEVGPALVQSNTGYVRVQSNTDDVIFYANGTENGRFSAAGGYFLVGKTANDQAVVGFQVNPGSFCQSNATVNTPMGALNKVGAGVGAGHDFIHFRNNGTAIGSVTRNGTTSAVLYNTTSDYRLKNDLGPITNAIERIMMLKPRRITWKEDVTEQEQDAFLAHEVTPVAPWAVTGEKDAVADEDNEDAGRVKGEIIPQQLDSSRLIPLLTAAVQELTERVRELEGATA